MAAGLQDTNRESGGWAKGRGTRTRRAPGFGANCPDGITAPERAATHLRTGLRTHSFHGHPCHIPKAGCARMEMALALHIPGLRDTFGLSQVTTQRGRDNKADPELVQPQIRPTLLWACTSHPKASTEYRGDSPATDGTVRASCLSVQHLQGQRASPAMGRCPSPPGAQPPAFPGRDFRVKATPVVGLSAAQMHNQEGKMWGESIQLANIILGRKSRFKKKKKNEGVAKKKISGSHLVIPALCRNNRLGMLAKL